MVDGAVAKHFEVLGAVQCRGVGVIEGVREADAVIVGSRDHAEIWAPDRWDVYRRALDDPGELARAVEGLGI